MKKILALSVVAVLCAVVTLAGDDKMGDKKTTHEGTITKMEWTNPHSWLFVNAISPDGKVEGWEIEFGAPNTLYRAGWAKRDLPVGGEVVITGFRSKDGRPAMAANNVTLADGRAAAA